MLKTVATYVICNNLSINIIDIEYGIEDKILWKWSNSDKLHKTKIYNSRKGRYYFLVDKIRYYLDEFINLV